MTLNDLLKTFHGGTSSEESITNEFTELSKKILYGGHFRIKKTEGTKNIYPEVIEFYYHEENGSLKDPIMYHTNLHAPKGTAFPYYKLGRLNLHQSGIDVTFENETMEYRASFLIRAYSVDNGEIEKRSTYLYDAMFDMSLPITIEWVPDEIPNDIKEKTLKGSWRQNVAKYEKEKGSYIKMEATNTDSDETTFSYNGKKYVKCTRMWRFEKGEFEQ